MEHNLYVNYCKISFGRTLRKTIVLAMTEHVDKRTCDHGMLVCNTYAVYVKSL